MFDVVTFGSAVIDTFVNTNVAEKNNFMNYPVGSKLLIKELRYDIGGGGTNTATAFSRLGLKTGCISGIGKDTNAKEIISLLKKEKIKLLTKPKNEMSGYSVILDSKEHNRTILTYKGANDCIKIEDIKKFKTKWLYYSSLMETSFETQIKLAKKLNNAGVKLAFNPSSYQIESKNILDLLKITEILILNKEEAEMISKKYKKKGNLLKAISELGPKIVVVTDKNNPAEAYDGEKIYKIEPHRNIKVLERTGAGDAFASGFVAGQIVGL